MTTDLTRTGQARITIRNAAGLHLTYRVRKCQPWTGRDGRERPGIGHWVDVRSGDDWISCGKLDDRGTRRDTANTAADALGLYGAVLIGMYLYGAQRLGVAGDTITAKGRTYSVHLEDRCSACGRELTDPVSIERGMGNDCYGKATGSKAAKVHRVA